MLGSNFNLAGGYMGYMPMDITSDLMAQGLPGGFQGPAQGPNTLIRNYGGQYMPYEPGGEEIPQGPTGPIQIRRA